MSIAQQKTMSHDLAKEVVHKSKNMQFVMREIPDLTHEQAFFIGLEQWKDPHFNLKRYWGVGGLERRLEPQYWFTDVYEKMAKAVDSDKISGAKMATSIRHSVSNGFFDFYQKAITSADVTFQTPKFIDKRLVDVVARKTPAFALTPKKVMMGKGGLIWRVLCQ